MYLDTPEGEPDDKIAWGSDVAAQMLRRFGFKYVSLNPGASYRGLHDSLVNHLGNRNPGMLLCLHEDHAIGIAHGYAKATDEPMAAIVHSNVGLMHGHMAIFNAFCDRKPLFLMGATGPMDAHQRRPWIDWIHTSSDQAAIVRDIIKFDNQPTSAEAIVDAMTRANIATRTEPQAPVYIVLDAGLGEQSLEKAPAFPDMARFKAPASPRAQAADMLQAVEMLKAAKRPMILYGRGTRSQEAWDNRVKLAEAVGACVMSDLKNGAAFPTDHPAHVIEPFNQPGKPHHDLLAEADLILALEWIDLGGCVCPPKGGTNVTAKIINVTMDHHLHNGAHMVYQSMSPADLLVSASSEAFVADLVAALGGGRKEPWRASIRKSFTPSTDPSRIRMQDVAIALREQFKNPDDVTLAAVARQFPVDLWPFRSPLAYMGKDGGGGIGSGPSISIGVAIACADMGRPAVTVLGDGDFMMGGNAIWTAVKHQIPILFVINNNQSYFNDELHQENVARRRNRPVGNRWIGQAMNGPALDIAKFAESQGAVGIGPVKTLEELDAAVKKGVEILNAGGVCLLDVHIPPGAERSAGSTGLRNT
ncbi:MAG: Acetolactate synthase large subunit [Hyphomicrobiales bacterium]|nr:Acetolactate synthase large subunit [Hyphomicrobiales bacterium]